MNLTEEEIRELLVILNLALLDTTDENHKALIRKWITRLSRQQPTRKKR